MQERPYQNNGPASQAVLDLAEETTRIEEDMRGRIERALIDGYWHCSDCDEMCERIESDQGQPAKCSHCGGVRLAWIKPAWQQVAEAKIIQPGDLQ